MIDHIGAVYAIDDIEVLWPIELGANCDEIQIGQLRD